MAVSIDSNTWYQLMNFQFDLYLAYNSSFGNGISGSLSEEPISWQFLDPSVASGGNPSQQWLLRPSGYPAYCLDASTGSLLLDECSVSTSLWQATWNFDNDSAWTLYNDPAGYVSAYEAEYYHLELLSTFLTGSDQGDELFSLLSVGSIDDSNYLTLPYTVTNTEASYPTTTDTSSTYTTPDDPSSTYSTYYDASSTSTTFSDYSSTYTTGDISATPPASSGSPAQQTSTSFTMSIVDKSVRDLGVIADLILPPHTDVGCENCTATGNIEISAGGYDPSSNDLVAAEQFLDNGYFDIRTTDFSANITLDFEFLPGFTLVDTFVSLWNRTIANFAIANALNVEFSIEFGIPFTVQLDTPVTFSGGFLLTIPDASLTLNFADLATSGASGWETSHIQMVPFHVSAPKLQLSAKTGLEFRILANATTHIEDYDAGGLLTFKVDMPGLNLTGAGVDDVDDNCFTSSGSTVHKHAVNLTLTPGIEISGEGELSIGKKDFKGDDFPLKSWELEVPNECLYDDKLKAAFLDAIASAAPRGQGDIRWWHVICPVVAVGMWLGIA